MKINVRIIRFLIRGIFVVVCINQQVHASAIIDEIVNLAKENQKLDKEIIKLTKFELSRQRKSLHKIILKDESNHLWLFKNYKLSIPVKNSIAVYYLASLFGIQVPPIYEINLPVNGKMVYGSVQLFIDNNKTISNVVPWELSKKQIKLLQRHHILDYFVCNPDAGGDNYIIKLKNGSDFLLDIREKDIIAVDKDNSFYKILNSPYDLWNDIEPYYYRLWKAYIKKKVDLDFTGGFQLIGYIQSIDVKKIEQLLIPFFGGRETFLRLVLSRTSKLRITFEGFYQDLTNKRGEDCQSQVTIENKEEYAQAVLKKIEKIVLQKKKWLKSLKAKQSKKQRNIEVIFYPEGFNKVRALEDVSRKDIAVKVNELLNKFKILRKNSISVYEKFALSLYIYDVEDISRKRPLECLLREPIENIVMSPDDIDVYSCEYTLRTFYKLSRQISGEILKKFDYHSQDILKHLTFIQSPINWEERKIILAEYKKQVGDNSLVKFVKGMLFNEIEYFEQIEDSFDWKCLGKGMLYWLYEEWDKAMQEYQKAITLSNDKTINFFGYRLLGFILEHNDQRVRFSEGFDVDGAITNYEKALEIKPDSVEVRLNLASLYLIKGLSEEALKEFKKIEKLDTQYGKKHFHLNEIKEKDLYESEKEYLEAVKTNTFSGEHHYVLGLAYAVKKQNGLAKKHFVQARKFGYKIDVDLK